jgi:hypothetical protein
VSNTTVTIITGLGSSDLEVSYGSRGPAGATGATGVTGAAGSQGDRAGLKYRFDTQTNEGAPSAGHLKFNSATLSAVTRISIRDTDFDGNDTSALLALIDDSTSTIKARVVIRSNSNSDTSHFNFLVTSVTDEGNHHHINGTYVSGSAFADNEIVTFDFYVTGNDALWNFRGDFDDTVDSIRITGALTAANGDSITFPDLAYDGDLDGKPSYRSGNSVCYWQTASNPDAWVIYYDDTNQSYAAWYSFEDVASPELVTGWNSGTTENSTPVVTLLTGVFEVGDVVTYEGETWYCYNAYTFNPASPQYPEIGSAYWQLIAAKGDTGQTGPQGPTGDTGPTGPTGPEPSLTIADNANTAITLSDADNNRVVRCTASSAVTVTVPSTLAAGFSCMVIQAGTGQVTFVAGSGATLNSFGNLLKTAGQHAPASLMRVGAGVYNLSGNLV